MISDDVLRKRFMAHVSRQHTGCWRYNGRVVVGNRPHLYGGFRMNGNVQYAHWASYVLFVAKIPENQAVRHLCHNGRKHRCVNPKHLTLGTKEDHRRDVLDSGSVKRTSRRPYKVLNALKKKRRDPMCVEVRMGDLPKGMASLIRGLSREQGFGIVDGGVRDETGDHEEHQEYPEPIVRKRKVRKLEPVVAVVVPRVVTKMKGGLLSKKKGKK